MSYEDILIKSFGFDATYTGFAKLKQFIQAKKNRHHMKEIDVGIETTAHYQKDLLKTGS